MGLADKIVSDDPLAQRDFIQLLKADGSNYHHVLMKRPVWIWRQLRHIAR